MTCSWTLSKLWSWSRLLLSPAFLIKGFVLNSVVLLLTLPFSLLFSWLLLFFGCAAHITDSGRSPISYLISLCPRSDLLATCRKRVPLVRVRGTDKRWTVDCYHRDIESYIARWANCNCLYIIIIYTIRFLEQDLDQAVEVNTKKSTQE